MKLKHYLLLFFIYVVWQATARHTDHVSDILPNINFSSKRYPLIVVLNTKNQPQNSQDSGDYDDLYITGDDGVIEDNEDEAKEEAKYLLYNYLLRTRDPQNTEEATEDDKRYALREALRARCQARVQCEKKCEKRKKKKKNCTASCKAVFDTLNLCEPPKKESKCKQEDKCGKRGKTMPPKWF